MTNEERIRHLLATAEKFDGLADIKRRIANREQLRKEKREKLKELMEKDKQPTPQNPSNQFGDGNDMTHAQKIEFVKSQEQMKQEIIYTENYALIVSDKQAKENDWGYIPFEGGQVKLIGKFFADDWRKIIAHRPLKDAPILEGVDLINETYSEI